VTNGVVISAVGLPGTTAGTLTANSVNVWTPPVRTHARGTVTGFTTTSITLKNHGNSTTYTMVPGTTTFAEGKTAGVYTDLATGENVSIALTSTTPQTVTAVTICLVRFFGTVTNFADNVITLTGLHGATLSVTVVPGTTTYTSDGAASTSAAVTNGVVISAVGLPGTTAGTLTANSVNVGTPNGQGFGQSHSHGHAKGFGKGHGKIFGHGHH
jgi:hypothetical protein